MENELRVCVCVCVRCDKWPHSPPLGQVKVN